MASSTYPVAVVAAEASLRAKPSNYPEPFASQIAGRRKQPLGDLFGLTNFGVNLTRLLPGAVSALHHAPRSKMSSSTYCRGTQRYTLTKVEQICHQACVLGSKWDQAMATV
jgi:uncharacterized cupin superfamily protein